MTYNEVIGCSQALVLDLVTIAEQLYYPPEEQEDAGQGRRSLAKSFTLVNRYSVSGRCRFCSTGTTKLFNDALRRKLQQESTTEEFNAAALINLNAAGIVSVTSVSATNERPLDGDETQLLGDIDALVEGIVESQPSAFGGSV
jgi:site-specific DNA-adenine methylase